MFCKLEVQIHPLESQHPDCCEGLEWPGWQKTTRISPSPILDVPGQAFRHRLWWKMQCVHPYFSCLLYSWGSCEVQQLFLMHFGNYASEMFYKFMGLFVIQMQIGWNTITFPQNWSISLIKPNLMELSRIRLSPKGSVISYIVSFSLWIGVDLFFLISPVKKESAEHLGAQRSCYSSVLLLLYS